MNRAFISVLCLFLLAPTAYAQEKKYNFSKQKMGSPFNIIMVSDDSAKAADLANRCYRLVDSFNSVFSDYDPGSELGLINAAAGKGKQVVSPAMKELLLLSTRAYKRSGRTFDVTIGPLSRLWRKSRKAKRFPLATEVSSATGHVGLPKLIIDSINNCITVPDSAMRLDFGGIAKGYIAQKVIDLLEHSGITQALADAGGDMVMSKAAQNMGGWTVGINIPETTDQLLPRYLLLQNKAVATSGDAYQYIEHDGKKYSHIIDPRTGYGVQSQRNVTVIADNGSDADWLATACSILPIRKAKQVAVRNGAELLITEFQDGKVVCHMTKGFANYWKQ